MIKKYDKFFILILILFLSLGVVYADNLDDTHITSPINQDIDEDVATENVLDENILSTIDDNHESISQVNLSNTEELSEDAEIDNVLYVEGSTFEDIQKAINSSKPGDKIILKGNYTGKNVINVKKTLTIEGYDNNVFLNAIGTESLIQISSIAENVTLKNLRFSYRGYNDRGDQSYYSPIKWFGKNGTIINCHFNNCTSHDSGGAISWSNSKGSILNCTFYNCTSFASGGAISWSSQDGIIDNCVFKDCNCAGLYQFGGAIYNWASNSKVSNCLFEDTYSNNGAAIFSDIDSTVNITINKCIFKNSYATIGDPLYGGVAIDCTFDFENNYETLMKYHAKLSSSNYNSYYLSTKKLAVKLLKTIDNKPLENVKLQLKVKVGNSYKNLYATTGSNGIAYFNLKSLNVGTYKTVTVSSTNSNIIVSTNFKGYMLIDFYFLNQMNLFVILLHLNYYSLKFHYYFLLQYYSKYNHLNYYPQ